MKPGFDKELGVPTFGLSDGDIDDARAIKKMMDTKGWKILARYMEVGRESIIDAGKDGIRTRGKKDLSPEKWAVLKGWDEAGNLPKRIVKRAEEFMETQKEEANNDDGHDDTN